MAAMFVPKQKKICSHSLHKNGSKLPEEKNLIVPNHQHGRHDVTCNQLIGKNNEPVPIKTHPILRYDWFELPIYILPTARQSGQLCYCLQSKQQLTICVRMYHTNLGKLLGEPSRCIVSYSDVTVLTYSYL